MASSKVLSNTFISIGIEDLTAGAPAFINFPKDLILNRIPLMFSPENLVIEILEDVEPGAEIIEVCRDFAERGYLIALDDFTYSPKYNSLLTLSKIVKLDFRALSPDELKSAIRNLAPFRVQLLAEKVETYEEFQQAHRMGFTLFQGYFFSKPEVVRGKDVTAQKLSLLQIMAEVNNEDFGFEKLEAIITRDVAVSYKLLRYVNSAYFRRLREVTSIGQAIFMLGEKQIRRFVSLIAMSTLGAEKPDELIRTSAARAKFCELVGSLKGDAVLAAELFTLGLFSLIDAILDESMESLMEKLPLSASIEEALVGHSGPLAEFLNLVAAYERGEWDAAAAAVSSLKIDEEALPRCLSEALGWANALSGL